MKSGVHSGISNEAYQEIAAINKSGLDLIESSPLHYWARYLDPEREIEEPTPAMLLGTAIHTAVLEPACFERLYAAMPMGLDRRTKEGKAAFAELEAAGKIVLNADSIAACKAIGIQVRSHPAARAIFEAGQAEQTVLWDDPELGVQCKARADWIGGGGKLLVDLKSTEDASPSEFAKTIFGYRYYRQAAWYLDGYFHATGVMPEGFIFAAFEKKPPYACAFYMPDQAMLERGRMENRELLRKYAACLKAGEWPGYPEDLQLISLPRWAINTSLTTNQENF